MKCKLLSLLLLFICLITVFPLQARKTKWKLIWEENFNGRNFNTGHWSKIPRGSADWNNYMSDNEACYEVKDGNLILRGIVNDVDKQDTARYLTGGIYTKDKFTVEYAKVEVKAKLQAAQGAWPAIWMLPAKAKWPYGGEIDIMERLNHDTIVYQTVHSYYTHILGHKDNPKHTGTNFIKPDGYNVYGVEIHPDSLVFSVNGKHTFTYPRIETDKEGQFPFGTPFYLLIDMQIEGNWVGQADPNELPVEMKVDWVKVYGISKKQ